MRHIDFFDDVVNKVTGTALKKIYKEYLKLTVVTETPPLEPCDEYYTKVIGLPRAHISQRVVSEERKIGLSDIHSHW